MLYKNKFGTVHILQDEEFYNNKTIGISMSGGADSTMLCYLLANTIQARNLNIEIQPYNGYDISVPGDSAGLPNIISFIQSKFPSVKLHWPIACVYDTKGADIKNTYIRPLIERLCESKIVDEVIQAVCLGPPKDVQEGFIGEDYFRRPGYALWEEVAEAKNHAPFVNVDKRFVAQSYIDLNILELLDHTNSCVRPEGDCGKCWWCQERAWAIQEANK